MATTCNGNVRRTGADQVSMSAITSFDSGCIFRSSLGLSNSPCLAYLSSQQSVLPLMYCLHPHENGPKMHEELAVSLYMKGGFSDVLSSALHPGHLYPPPLGAQNKLPVENQGELPVLMN